MLTLITGGASSGKSDFAERLVCRLPGERIYLATMEPFGKENLSRIARADFEMIKIDKYIVWAAFTDKRAEKALAATIKMIKSIGMTVLAEGVETPEQAEWLTASGCDYLQGFYYSRPIPKKDFLDIMKQNKEN